MIPVAMKAQKDLEHLIAANADEKELKKIWALIDTFDKKL